MMCAAVGIALVMGFSALSIAIVWKAILAYAEHRETQEFWSQRFKEDRLVDERFLDATAAEVVPLRPGDGGGT